MAQSKKTPCQRCGVGAYGRHCRDCDQTLKPIHVRMAKPNTAGQWEQQPSVGVTRTLLSECAPTDSWWACPDEEFPQRLLEQLPRQQRANGISYQPKEQLWN